MRRRTCHISDARTGLATSSRWLPQLIPVFRLAGAAFSRSLLLFLLLTGVTSAAELPGERLGHPVRIHIARGLWWQFLGLYEAVATLGGAALSSSVDVYGNPTGYHGCAQAMGTFPHSRDQLAEQDLIILAGSRAAALPATTQTALVAWVEAGGGLLITGGPLSLDCDTYGPLAAILPVRLTQGNELMRISETLLQAADGSGLETFDWAARPRVYWFNAGAEAREDSQVLLRAGANPLLVMRQAGKGHVAVFAGTVCGESPEGETAFWDWPDWPRVVSTVLAKLAPRAPVELPRIDVAPATLAAARRRLAEIQKTQIDIFNDALGESNGNGDSPHDSVGAELARLAELTVDADFAQALVQTTVETLARLSLEQAKIIFAAVEPHLPLEAARQAHGDLIQSTSPGTAALGLRLAGMAGLREAGPRMVNIVRLGLDASPSADAETAVGIPSMQLPDGADEGLRLAAVQALADLAHPDLIAPLKQALADWERQRNRSPLLEAAQAEVEEMGMAALAAMGDGQAAAWIIERRIANSLARETAVDISEYRGRNPSPEQIKERNEAARNAVILAVRNHRIDRLLFRLPASTWSTLAARAQDWHGEFATEVLLLALAERGGPPLSADSRKKLRAIAKATPLPALRRLCERRIGPPLL